jgi:hypothetical protein
MFDASMGVDPNKNLINRLVSSKIYSVENSSKWITDEHEEGSYDYKIRNLEEENDDSE